VTYEVIGPDFEAPPDCPTDPGPNDQCYPYDGPTDPGSFADITIGGGDGGGATTITGTEPTGMTRAVMEMSPGGSTEWYYNETGPLQVQATLGDSEATTSERSTVAVEAEGEIDPLGARDFTGVASSLGTPLWAGEEEPFLDDDDVFAGAHHHPAQLAVQYTILHGPGTDPRDGIIGLDEFPWAASHLEWSYDVGHDEIGEVRAHDATDTGAGQNIVRGTLQTQQSDGSWTNVTQRFYSGSWTYQPPRFSANTQTPDVGETVTFDASVTANHSTNFVVYEWSVDGEVEETNYPDFNSGSSSFDPADPTFEHSFSEAGPEVVSLTLKTPNNVEIENYPIGPATRVIQVGDTGEPQPVFDFGPLEETVTEGWELTFDASASTGDIQSYTWNFTEQTGTGHAQSVEFVEFEDAGPTIEHTPFYEEVAIEWQESLPACAYDCTWGSDGFSGVLAPNEIPAEGRIDIRDFTAPTMGLSFTPDEYSASEQFILQTDSGGGGAPPPAPIDPDWGQFFDISASPSSSGQLHTGDALTTRNNEFTEYSDTPDPDWDRGDIWDVHSSDAVAEAMYINATEGQTQEYYGWINAEAIIEDAKDAFALKDGIVDWRSNGGCTDIDGCHDEPTAVVDFTDTTSIEWDSSIDIHDPENEATIAVDAGQLNKPGQHWFELDIDVSDPLNRDYIYTSTTIEAVIDETSHNSIDEEIDGSASIPTEIEVDDEDPPGGD